MRALWQDPDYRQRMSVALRGIEKRPLTAEQRKEVSRIVSQKSREMWSNENKRAEIIAAIVNAMASDPFVGNFLLVRERPGRIQPIARSIVMTIFHGWLDTFGAPRNRDLIVQDRATMAR